MYNPHPGSDLPMNQNRRHHFLGASAGLLRNLHFSEPTDTYPAGTPPATTLFTTLEDQGRIPPLTTMSTVVPIAWVPIYASVAGPTPAQSHTESSASNSQIPPNTAYLYPPESQHATIHVVRGGYDSAKAENEMQNQLMFDSLYVPLNLTGNQFIEQLGGGSGWGILEIYEVGDGKWRRGLGVKHGDNVVAKKTLHNYGFYRGQIYEPVWVVLRKV
jgi:hypothetical protein